MNNRALNRVETATCCTCGYSWPKGQDGSHSCAEHLHKDAMRYRWARKQDADVLMDLYVAIPGAATPEEFDAVIDEAMNRLIEGAKDA